MAIKLPKDLEIIVVQSLSAEVPGKAQKYYRAEAHEFVSFEDLKTLGVTVLHNWYPRVIAAFTKQNIEMSNFTNYAQITAETTPTYMTSIQWSSRNSLLLTP